MTLPYLDHIRSDTAAFLSAARGNLDRQVPSCPEWNVGRLASHVWGVFWFWGTVAAKRLQDPRKMEKPNYPSDDEVLDALDLVKEQLLQVLDTTDPATRIWTWSRDKSVGFLPRRMAHEIAVHRWDCENAVGTPNPIEADLAWDGVKEFFDNFFWRDGSWEGREGRIEFHRADVEDMEIVQLAGDSLKPDLIVTGDPSDLDLMLWRRVGTENLEVEGDRALLNEMLAFADLG